LSRAKHGLYIFGNASQLKMQSVLWKEVLEILEKGRRCSQTIDIYCQKHSDKEKQMVDTTVRYDVDIPPEGGCTRQCGEIMNCGHVSNQIIKL
jgi:helicase required for RNAi-mediated heterochromatin assembly 1